MPTRSLLAPDAETLEKTGKQRAQLVTEGHERLTQPLMAIVAPLIGFAALMIGEFSRFGLWRQIALAVGAVVVLYMASNAATSMVQLNDRLWPVMYGPAVLGVAMTAAMLAWSGRTRRVPVEAAP